MTYQINVDGLLARGARTHRLFTPLLFVHPRGCQYRPSRTRNPLSAGAFPRFMLSAAQSESVSVGIPNGHTRSMKTGSVLGLRNYRIFEASNTVDRSNFYCNRVFGHFGVTFSPAGENLSKKSEPAQFALTVRQWSPDFEFQEWQQFAASAESPETWQARELALDADRTFALDSDPSAPDDLPDFIFD